MGFENLPDVSLVRALPPLQEGPNQTPIQSHFADLDPTTALGCLIHKPSKQVLGLETVLKDGVKIDLTSKKDVLMNSFVENSLVIEIGWLSFIRADINWKTRAEVSIVKILTSSIKREDVDDAKLQKILGKILVPGQYGVICGFVCYQFSASLFKDIGMDASASGFGAKIEGKWYSKTGDTAAYPYLMAVWWPLTDYHSLLVSSEDHRETNLGILAEKAIKSGLVKIEPLDSLDVTFKPHTFEKKKK